MKVLLLSDANSIHTQRWVAALAKKGVEIFLFSRDRCETSWHKNLPGVSVYGYTTKQKATSKVHNSLLIKLIFYFPLLFKIRKTIRSFSPDIVHAHFASTYGLYGALCGFSPFVLSVWGSDVYEIPEKSSLARYLLKFTLSRADCICSTSRAMAAQTRRYTDKSIRVIPFGVDTETFKKMEGILPGGGYVIGTIKRLHPRYGIDTLIEACALLIKKYSHRPILLMIAGEGPSLVSLQQKARELGIENKVSFTGKIRHEEVPAFLSGFSVFVALSRQESFGVAAVEAMACECPVIVSDAEGFLEIVRHSETGWIVPRENPEAAALAIEKLMNHPTLGEQMAKKAREDIILNYAWAQKDRKSVV